MTTDHANDRTTFEHLWHTYKALILTLIAIVGLLVVVLSSAVAQRVAYDNCLDHNWRADACS